MSIYDKLVQYLNTLPDKDFVDRLNYYDRNMFEAYMRDRRERAMKPIQEKRDVAQARAKQNEVELEKKIVAWAKNPKNLYVGLRVKFKGTRDDGYRKIHSINGEQVIGFQFYYRRRMKKDSWEDVLVDQTSTTSNHVSKIRKVLIRDEWIPIKELIQARKTCPHCRKAPIFSDTHYCVRCEKEVHYDQIK